MTYCKCKYGGSPSLYHGNCNDCGEKIKTIYEKYAELKEEVEKLRKHKQILLDAIEPFARSGWDDLKKAKQKVL